MPQDLKKLALLIPAKYRAWYINKTVPGRGWTYEGSKIKGIRNTDEAIQAVLHNNSHSIDDMVKDVQTKLQDPNLSEWERQNLLGLLSHQDGLSIYLGQPQRSNMFVPAKDQPTIGQLNNGMHLTLMDSPVEKETLVRAGNNAKRKGEISRWYINPYFRNVKASIGIDPSKGEYVSYYKKYDYGEKEGQYDTQIDKYTGGTPFDVYGRVYLDDYYGVNSQPKSGDYYGGYLPEIEVHPKNQKDLSFKSFYVLKKDLLLFSLNLPKRNGCG